jgi:predicted ATP-grasp superfamily ATP-dependent carboligase
VTTTTPARHGVLLAGGNDRSMLAAGRSLARRGVPFVVVGVSPRDMVGASRHIRRRIVDGAPHPTREPREYAEFVRDVARRHAVELIVPLTDRILRTCDVHRGLLEAEAPLAAPPSAAARNVLDKRLNLETARQLGVPCPAEFELETREQVPELIERLGFPLVLKNPGPSATGDRASFDFAWLVARDRRELDHYLEHRCPPDAFPLFQEYATGSLYSLCCFAARGELAAVHAYRRLRRVRGMSSFRELAPVRPDLRAHAERLLHELRWDGAAHISFYVEDGEGAARYMETNGRFWGPLEASVAVGFDFPFWTYRYFTSGELPDPPPPTHEVGRRFRWHYGDLEGLVRYLGGNDEPRRTGQGRLGAVVDYLAGFAPGVRADVFRWDDPFPELVEHTRARELALQRLWRHLARDAVRRLAGPRALERLRNLRNRRSS